MASTSDVIGVVILARHGDRQGFYQDPLTYAAAETAITPLGNVRSLGYDSAVIDPNHYYPVASRVRARPTVAVIVH